jgi:hypothetical protein
MASRFLLKKFVLQEGDWVEGVKVPAGHIYVLGDNLGKSRDSRLYGSVPINLVEYRAVVRVRHAQLVFSFLPSERVSDQPFHLLRFRYGLGQNGHQIRKENLPLESRFLSRKVDIVNFVNFVLEYYE